MPFQDYKVFILRPSNKVHHVMAERAYASPQKCINALVATKSSVLAVYPNIRTKGNSPISYREGDLSIDLSCLATEGSRYMVLTLTIFSQSQSNELRRMGSGLES